MLNRSAASRPGKRARRAGGGGNGVGTSSSRAYQSIAADREIEASDRQAEADAVRPFLGKIALRAGSAGTGARGARNRG